MSYNTACFIPQRSYHFNCLVDTSFCSDGTHPNQQFPERSHLLGNPVRTQNVQWYIGGEGEAALKYVFDELAQIADGDVNMSRDKVTQDISMNFMHRGREWVVKFPPNFPRSKARLSSNGEERGESGGDTVQLAVRRMISVLISSLHQQNDVQWYADDEGEADLKHVFDELKRIADGEVKMRRKTDTQDVTLKFERQGQAWQVKFPFNFPRSPATLVKNGEELRTVGGNTIETATGAIINHIIGQWYATDEGEDDLRYVFDELKQIADDDVEMSRNTDTQDITFSLERHGNQWQVKFPSDFPSSNAKLTFKGDVYAAVGGDSLEVAVSAIKNRISSVDNPAAKTVFWKAVACPTS